MKILKIILLLVISLQANALDALKFYSFDDKYRDDAVRQIEQELVERSNVFESEQLKALLKVSNTNPLFAYYEARSLFESKKIEAALERLMYSVSYDVVTAKMYLAEIKTRGLYLEKNFDEAIELYEEVFSKSRLPEAALNAGLLLMLRDKVKAVQMLKVDELDNNPEAQFQLAMSALMSALKSEEIDAKNNMEVIERFERAINLGHKRAGLELAKFRLMTAADKYEKLKAVESLKEIALQNNAEASRIVGQLYIYGHGVDKDTDLAIGWLKKSAGLGDTKSLSLLGLAYSRKAKDKASLLEAEKWFVEAAKSGERRYVELLARFYINYSEANPEYEGKGEHLLKGIIE